METFLQMIDLNQPFKHILSCRILVLTTFQSNEEINIVHSYLDKLLIEESISKLDYHSLVKNIHKALNTVKEQTNNKNISLLATLYFILILLVELTPINDTCVKTWNEISSNKKIHLSTGYQFDIDVIAEHILKQKKFSDLFSGDIFSKRDIAHILSFPHKKTAQLTRHLPPSLSLQHIEEMQLEMAQLLEQEESLKIQVWAESKEKACDYYLQPSAMDEVLTPLSILRANESFFSDDSINVVLETEELGDESICDKFCIIS